MTNQPRERLEELFVAELLFDLTAEERAEYEALAATHGLDELQPLADMIGFLDLARSDSEGARLPDALRERIRADAADQLRTATSVVPLDRRSARSNSRLAWSVAAVCLSLAIFAVATSVWRPFEPSNDPARMREQLLASATDLVRADWAPGPTPVPGAAGDIVWSAGEQSGYMRFDGLPVNDSSVEQYQLWIFDRNQPEATPVDGGVFDISSTGEVVVPIRPTLRVREPYMFAVTVEKPGGVVVSDRSRLPLLATVSP